jgi:putative membrane protein
VAGAVDTLRRMPDDATSAAAGPRRPRAVYGVGEDPDPRFSMANERTLLAWLRTSLAFVAAGIGAVAIGELVGEEPLVRLVSVLACVVGALSAVTAYVRWGRVERALRLRQPLPSPVLGPLLVLAVVVVAGVGTVLGLTG